MPFLESIKTHILSEVDSKQHTATEVVQLRMQYSNQTFEVDPPWSQEAGFLDNA